MILFCDTSALIKIYIQEIGSQQIKQELANASSVAVSRVTWVEAHAAFARRVREQVQDASVFEFAKKALQEDWPSYVVTEVTSTLTVVAANYADAFALRAYDSVQLASAIEVKRIAQSPVLFACYDLRLNKAASLLGLDILN